MNELMQRRRALMEAAKEEPLALVSGSYDNGKIIVSNGTHLSINSPTVYAISRIPLTREIAVSSGDEISFKAGGTNTTLKSRFYGVTINGINYENNQNKPSPTTWYNITGFPTGRISDITVRTNEYGWYAEIDFSLRINGEVIL